VEREVVMGLPQTVETMELVLDKADFTNAKRTAEVVNAPSDSRLQVHPGPFEAME
jgi:flagellar basal body P-ring protein FlgI